MQTELRLIHSVVPCYLYLLASDGNVTCLVWIHVSVRYIVRIIICKFIWGISLVFWKYHVMAGKEDYIHKVNEGLKIRSGIRCFHINMITYLYLALLAIHFISPPLSPSGESEGFGFPPSQGSTLTPPLLV